MQEQQPVAFGDGRAVDQLGAPALPGVNDMGACGIGNRQSAVIGTAIADDHLAHHAPHGCRYQAVEAARQKALGVGGGDDDRNHDTIMTQLLHRAKEFPVAVNASGSIKYP